MMNRILGLASSLIFSSFLVACGGGENPDRMESVNTSQKVGGESVKVLQGGSTLKFAIEGTGAVRTTNPMASVDDGANFSLRFSLEPGGKVTLVTFSDINLNSGLEIEYSRKGSTTELQVLIRHAGSVFNASSSFAGVDASTELSIAADVHNNEKPAHIVIWNDSNGQAGDDDFVFNTGTVQRSSPGDGKGVYWGVRLQNARVREMSRSGVRDSH